MKWPQVKEFLPPKRQIPFQDALLPAIKRAITDLTAWLVLSPARRSHRRKAVKNKTARPMGEDIESNIGSPPMCLGGLHSYKMGCSNSPEDLDARLPKGRKSN